MLDQVENYLAQMEMPAEPELLYTPISYSMQGAVSACAPCC